MQNEFEKQVQQKMEELNLVPSDPVWQKVEMQIQKKKDRRRMVIWIPLFVVLAGALWLGIDQYSNKATPDKTIDKIQTPDADVASKDPENAIKKNNAVLVQQSVSQTQTKKKVNSKARDFNLSFVPIKSSGELKTHKQISELIKSKASAAIEQSFGIESTIANNNTNQPQDKLNAPDTSLKTIQNSDTTTTSDTTEPTITPNPANRDSAVIKKPVVKKHALSKWKLNLVALAGSSGLGRINMYSGQKSLNTYNNPSAGSGGGSTGSQNGYGPSEVEKGSFFDIGVLAKKQLGKRTFFSSGLQYNYYSNTIEVGGSVNQARVIMDYSVTQFYSNQTNVRQPYKNQYHFISLPASLDWQLLKNHPLNFGTGLSLQYLLQTNGLCFDYTTQSYFHSIKAFNKTQLFWELGLTYSVPLRQKPLTFGTQLQYGLTQLEKDNADHHVFSYGLKIQWQLSKN
jgi:hypothetical protein